jgi:2,4-dienoyl-CoA reductase-like NADH-dependent reductase (Old Yellow Enzyme family)
MKKLEHLLTPVRIKSMEIPNRLVMPPMETALANDDNTVSEAILAYMRRRAKSGVGLIITEHVDVHPLGSFGPRLLGIWNDRFIPGLSRLIEYRADCPDTFNSYEEPFHGRGFGSRAAAWARPVRGTH